MACFYHLVASDNSKLCLFGIPFYFFLCSFLPSCNFFWLLANSYVWMILLIDMKYECLLMSVTSQYRTCPPTQLKMAINCRYLGMFHVVAPATEMGILFLLLTTGTLHLYLFIWRLTIETMVWCSMLDVFLLYTIFHIRYIFNSYCVYCTFFQSFLFIFDVPWKTLW